MDVDRTVTFDDELWDKINPEGRYLTSQLRIGAAGHAVPDSGKCRSHQFVLVKERVVLSAIRAC